MIISLDANVVIDLGNHHPCVTDGYATALRDGHDLILSVVVWQELRVGKLLHRELPQVQQIIELLISGMEVVPYEQADADSAARLRSASHRRQAGAHDFMIAGQALARGWTLATGNVRDFGRFSGLSHVNWRDGQVAPQTV